MMTRSLSFNEFRLLTALEASDDVMTVHSQSYHESVSDAEIEATLRRLTEKGYVAQNHITESGIDALEPYRVKRCVILAAGFGSRLAPLTISVPKPLLRIHGQRIIDSLIDAVLAVGIQEIYLVRGYLSELFDSLLPKYPMIHFIENPLYDKGNNILSIIAAGSKIANTYVTDSDIILKNPALITKYQYASNYIGVPVDETADWCLHSKGGIITSMSHGGKNCHHMYGISYWTEEDGRKLIRDAQEIAALPSGKQRFWDEIALNLRNDAYAIHLRPCSYEDIIEIDTVRELQKYDEEYLFDSEAPNATVPDSTVARSA